MKLLKKIFKILLLLALLATFFLIGYYYSVTNGVSLTPEKLLVNENTAQIFDCNDTPIANTSTLAGQEITHLEDIPEHLKFAFIDTEDRRFFTHNGFELKRIAKALVVNLKSFDFKEGASTISQQLIKNTHLSQQKTLKRKLQEFKLTYQLERKYSKNEILEKYLNTIYFGHSCFGITSATRFYFDKTPNELTISESAILAGLVKSPNNYSPFKNPEKCKNRRKTVLNAMYSMGHITKAELEKALAEAIPEEPNPERKNKHYFLAVFDELESIAETHNFSVGGKISVYTYLDQSLQNFLEVQSKALDCDCVLSVLNTETHGFSAHYKTAKITKRPPASIIKPLAVYAPSLEENLLSPATLLLDEPINFSGYSPKNYDGKYRGYISVREAISKSLNVPAVKTLNSIGIEKAVNYLEKMNLTIPKEDRNLALSLGGMQNGFTLNELVGAYSTFPSDGIFVPPAFIKSVSIDGEFVYKREIKEKKVFSDSTAYLMSDLLKTTAKDGTAKKLRTLNFDISAKTGTNGIDGNILDAYALSYTTKNVVGVWLGNASNTPIQHTGGGKPCDILYEINQFLAQKHNKNENKILSFKQPKSVKEVWLDKVEYSNSKQLLLADDNSPTEYKFKELFKTNTIPTKKASHFSNPTIETPTIQVENDLVTINFAKNTPAFYRIVVKKNYYAAHNNYVTHSTMYDGIAKNTLFDKIERGKSFFYTITPYFNEIEGKTIVLPKIAYDIDNKSPIQPDTPPDIIKRDWWNY